MIVFIPTRDCFGISASTDHFFWLLFHHLPAQLFRYRYRCCTLSLMFEAVRYRCCTVCAVNGTLLYQYSRALEVDSLETRVQGLRASARSPLARCPLTLVGLQKPFRPRRPPDAIHRTKDAPVKGGEGCGHVILYSRMVVARLLRGSRNFGD